MYSGNGAHPGLRLEAANFSCCVASGVFTWDTVLVLTSSIIVHLVSETTTSNLLSACKSLNHVVKLIIYRDMMCFEMLCFGSSAVTDNPTH